MVVQISLGICFGLIAIGVLAMLFSGIQSLIKGKQDFKKIVMMLLPFVAFGVSYAIVGELPRAGVITMLFMLALMILFIIFSGVRSTFNL